jgi:hypothetical protein
MCLAGCGLNFTYDFENNNVKFDYGVANVPADYEKKGYSIIVQQTEIPNINSSGLMISGYNMGDDMFIYCYINIGKILNLGKNKSYSASLRFDVATMMQKYDSNITGQIPAQSVIIKAGIMPNKPSVSENNGMIDADFKIGHYMADEEYIKSLGNIQKINYKSGTDFEYKTFDAQLSSSTDKDGNLYLIIGVDSYYIGPSWIFVDNINLEIN